MNENPIKNTGMISDLEQQLVQDGQVVTQQAQLRLAKSDVKQSLIAALTSEQVIAKNTLFRPWWYGFAAVIGITAMIWIAGPIDSIQPDQLSVSEPLDFGLKSLPLSLEQKFNQPLLEEQQAIIDDLKALKTQLLSI